MTIKLRNIISNLFLLSKLVCDYYVALLHCDNCKFKHNIPKRFRSYSFWRILFRCYLLFYLKQSKFPRMLRNATGVCVKQTDLRWIILVYYDHLKIEQRCTPFLCPTWLHDFSVIKKTTWSRCNDKSASWWQTRPH